MWLPDPPDDPLLAHRSSPTPRHSDDTDGELSPSRESKVQTIIIHFRLDFPSLA